MTIEVGHEEANIACTMVLLKAMAAVEHIPVPLSVELCLPGREDEGWRKASIEYLDAAYRRPRRGRPRKSVDWEEYNDRLDWEDKREHQR